jgi:hypothetical protein
LRRQDRNEELVDKLLIMRAPKGRRSMFRRIAWIHHQALTVGKSIKPQLRKPEYRAEHEWISLFLKPRHILRVAEVVLCMLHHPRRTGRVIRLLRRVFHARMSKDIHLVMRHPARSTMQQLRSLCAAWYPGIFHVVKGGNLESAETGGIGAPVVHLEVDVGVTVGAPGGG